MNIQQQQQNDLRQLHDVLSLLDLIADMHADKIGPSYLLASAKNKIQNVIERFNVTACCQRSQAQHVRSLNR